MPQPENDIPLTFACIACVEKSLIIAFKLTVKFVASSMQMHAYKWGIGWRCDREPYQISIYVNQMWTMQRKIKQKIVAKFICLSNYTSHHPEYISGFCVDFFIIWYWISWTFSGKSYKVFRIKSSGESMRFLEDKTVRMNHKDAGIVPFCLHFPSSAFIKQTT